MINKAVHFLWNMKRCPTFSWIRINKKRHICLKDINMFCLELLKLTVYVLQGNPVICRYTWYDIYWEITRIHRRRPCHAGPRYIGARCRWRKIQICHFRSNRHSFNNIILKDCMYLRQSIARDTNLPGQFDDEVELQEAQFNTGTSQW